MSRSTPRTSLPRAGALLLGLALVAGWAQSGPVLAFSTVEHGGLPAAAPFVAEPRLETVPLATVARLQAMQEAREAARAAAAAAVESKPVKQHVTVQVKAQVNAPAPKPAPKPSYSGTNRFWIPSLGMNDRVHLFECSRSREPDNYIYRWGCAGTNNVYILGHAYGVMKPLHDLYVRGGLRVGMVAIYADGQGRVHWYRVTEWRVVDPTEAAWAIASQPTPSMTLQTCVGKDGTKRLNVRLVQFKVT
jgi:hypothetical protein